MATRLPTEILTQIFEYAVPLATFDCFAERSTTLRNLALTCRAFRFVGQHLLSSHPVFVVQDGTEASCISDLLKQVRFASMKHLRVDGFDNQAYGFELALPKSVGVMKTLKSLSLQAITFDIDMLLNLPNLQSLSLQTVFFEYGPATEHPFLTAKHLCQLVNLSLAGLNDSLPPCLLADQLPVLQRLAIMDCENVTDNHNQYSLREIGNLRHQLDFFCCSTYDYTFTPAQLAPVADMILLDIESGTMHSEKHHLGAACMIKYLRLPWSSLDLPSVLNHPRDRMRSWNLSTLRKLVHVEYPNIEALVVPAEWRNSSHYNEFCRDMEEENVAVLLEEGIAVQNGESLISMTFGEYIRRRREKEVAI